MKFQMTVLVIGLMVIQAGAYEVRDIAAHNQRAKDLAAQVAELQKKVANNTREQQAINQRFERAQAAFQAAPTSKVVYACPNGSKPGDWFTDCTESTETVAVPAGVQKAYEDATAERKKIAALQLESAQLSTQIRDLNGQVGQAQTTATNLTAEQGQQVNVLNYVLGNLKNDTTNIKVDLLTNSQILDSIQNTYDKSVLGAYLKDKMSQLLASDSFCEAQNQCANKVPKANRAAALTPKFNAEMFKSQRFNRAVQPAAKPAGGTR